MMNVFKILHLISHFQPELRENKPKIPSKTLTLVLLFITIAKVPVKIPSSPTTIKALPYVSGLGAYGQQILICRVPAQKPSLE